MIPNNPFKTYTHKDTGRKFRVAGVSRNEDGKWINGEMRFKWMVSIRFTDNDEPCKLFFDEADQKYKEVWK